MIKNLGSYIKIDTANTTLLLKVEEWGTSGNEYHPENFHKGVAIMYYGKRLSDDTCYDVFGRKPLIIDRTGGALDEYIKGCMTHSTVGMGCNREALVQINNADGTVVNRFDYVRHTITDGGLELDGMPHARGGAQTLTIELADEVAKLRLVQYYTVFDDCDVIATANKLINDGDKAISFTRLFSLQLDLHGEKYTVSSYDGMWADERTRHQTKLDSNKFVIDSKTGASSPNHNPFFTIEGEFSDDNAYGFNLIYSGNHKEIVEVSPYGGTRVLSGMNDFMLDYEIAAGDSFTTPQAIMVNAPDMDGVTANMHKFMKKHVIRPEFSDANRPVLYNHWEGTGVDFNQDLLFSFADTAAKIGIELFVMDDGWFGKRTNDRVALGDWFVNRDRFPNGLEGLSKGIHDRGLQFGIWVEPEMISRDSDLYRAHPEYALESPGRKTIERRCQMTLDMSSVKVQDYLIDVLTDVFTQASPDYVKWDYNRCIIDTYSSYGTKAGEFYHKFILGTYRVIDTLIKRFPHVLFESCSSGGGRYDLGMFYYMPQTWGSDDSNSWVRTSIQCGTLAGYIQSSFGAHVTVDHCMNKYDKLSSIEDRFNLNAIGAFGYELNINAMTDEELRIMTSQIAFYKEHRHLLQNGTYYCMNNVFDEPDRYSFIVVSEDKSEAIAVLIEKDGKVNHLPKLWRFKGLDATKRYSVTMREQTNVPDGEDYSVIANGDALLSYGLDFGIIGKNTDDHRFSGINSRMFYIKEVK